MREHLFNHKRVNKQPKGFYNAKSNTWIKKRNVAYSDAYLNRFVRTIFGLFFVSSCLLWVFINLPFSGIGFAFDRGKWILAAAWIIYILIMLSLNRFVKSPLAFFISGTTISAIMLIFSDVIMNKYSTLIYNFFLFAAIICALYLLILRYIKYLTSRKAKPINSLAAQPDIDNS